MDIPWVSRQVAFSETDWLDELEYLEENVPNQELNFEEIIHRSFCHSISPTISKIIIKSKSCPELNNLKSSKIIRQYSF